MTRDPLAVIWHDLECGRYVEDLALWRSLAADHGDPVLDIGAGTGRVALDLARSGYRVTALDSNQQLVEALARRACRLAVRAVLADARDFDLQERFPLCIVPMQTIQLLEGTRGRSEFLRCARRHLVEGGVLAVTIAERLDPYEVREGTPAPAPDVRQLNGVIYSSQPTAVRVGRSEFVLERRREMTSSTGRTAEQDTVQLDRLTVGRFVEEARRAGLKAAGRARVAETEEYTGSEVVFLRG